MSTNSAMFFIWFGSGIDMATFVVLFCLFNFFDELIILCCVYGVI